MFFSKIWIAISPPVFSLPLSPTHRHGAIYGVTVFGGHGPTDAYPIRFRPRGRPRTQGQIARQLRIPRQVRARCVVFSHPVVALPTITPSTIKPTTPCSCEALSAPHSTTKHHNSSTTSNPTSFYYPRTTSNNTITRAHPPRHPTPNPDLPQPPVTSLSMDYPQRVQRMTSERRFPPSRAICIR